MSRGRRLLVIWLIGVMLLDMLIGAWAGIAVIEGVLAALAVLLPDRRTPAVRAPAVRNLPGTCVLPAGTLIMAGGAVQRTTAPVRGRDSDPDRIRRQEAAVAQPMAELIRNAEREAEQIHLASLPPLRDRDQRMDQIRAELEFAYPGASRRRQLIAEYERLAEPPERGRIVMGPGGTTRYAGYVPGGYVSRYVSHVAGCGQPDGGIPATWVTVVDPASVTRKPRERRRDLRG